MNTHDNLFGCSYTMALHFAEVATIITTKQLGSDTPQHDYRVNTDNLIT